MASGATTPARGVVTFFDAGAMIGTATLNGGTPDNAQFTISTLAVGTHPIIATYAGDNFNTSAASVRNQSGGHADDDSGRAHCAAESRSSGTAETITDTVTVTQGAATPTGAVTFTSGTTVLGTATLTAGGTATINPVLAPGNYTIVATYAGDTDDGGSQSAPVALTVDEFEHNDGDVYARSFAVRSVGYVHDAGDFRGRRHNPHGDRDDLRHLWRSKDNAGHGAGAERDRRGNIYDIDASGGSALDQRYL